MTSQQVITTDKKRRNIGGDRVVVGCEKINDDTYVYGQNSSGAPNSVISERPQICFRSCKIYISLENALETLLAWHMSYHLLP